MAFPACAGDVETGPVFREVRLCLFRLCFLIEVTDGKGQKTAFTYDLNGNRETHVKSGTGGFTDTLTWDRENHMTGLSRLGSSSLASYVYSYDYRARRVLRDESAASGNKTALSFSGCTSVLEWNTTTDVLETEHIRGSDWGGGVGGVLYSIRGGVRSFAAYNSRGDVVSRSDDSGAATWQGAYEAFGTRTQEQGSNQERQRANTKDEDPTGLLNEKHRYRDLEAGVFISRDPAGFVDGPNVYTYVRQNPWTAFDPEGLYEDFPGYVREVGQTFKGAGKGAVNTGWGMVKGAVQQTWNSHVLVNAVQLAVGAETGYQKNYKQGMANLNAAKELATSSEARAKVGEAISNYADEATRTPESFGEKVIGPSAVIAATTLAPFSKSAPVVAASEAPVVSAQATAAAKTTAIADGKFYSTAFETTLAPTSYPGVSRYMHFKEANVALDAAMQSNPALAELGISVPRSSSGSILGKSPENWVWHHDTGAGIMQLVPKSQHPNIPGGIFWETMHPGGNGGFSIWGK